MELYQLRAFIAVARHGSLTKAAERLYLSVPAVSAQIKALEDELSLQLFERTSKGMFATEVGRKLLDEAEQTLNAAGRMKSVAAEAKGQLSGCLRVGVLSDSVPLRVGDALLTLSLRHPNIGAALHQDVSGKIMERVRTGALDCGFALGDVPPVDLTADRLTEIGLAVALPAHIAARAAALDLEDIAQMPWIVSVPDCALHSAALNLFRATGHAPRAQHVADSDGGLRSMVSSGLGVGILRLSEAEAGARAGELAIWPHWRGTTWLHWVQVKSNTDPAISALREVVRESWRDSPRGL